MRPGKAGSAASFVDAVRSGYDAHTPPLRGSLPPRGLFFLGAALRKNVAPKRLPPIGRDPVLRRCAGVLP